MPNRLAGATSPYLLQHADNPVDWREWGEEAFVEARERDVPVLLSVGYAACHWFQVHMTTVVRDPAGIPIADRSPTPAVVGSAVSRAAGRRPPGRSHGA
jgi:hypothetical protein